MSPRQRLRVRVGTWAYVTGVECAGLYRWLRDSVDGREGRGAIYLVLEETLESGLLLLIFVQGPQQQPQNPDPAVAAHLQSAQRASALAINAEIVIWLVWFSMIEALGPVPATIYLLVTMHLKHQLEAATVLDEPFWSQFRATRVVIGSLSEVIGATASSKLMRAGRRRAAAGGLLAGIGFEHVLFINAVQDEMAKRDICLPRSSNDAGGDPAPRSDGDAGNDPAPSAGDGVTGRPTGPQSGAFVDLRKSLRQRGLRGAATYWLATNVPDLWRFLNRPGLTHSVVNDNIINQFVMSMEPRPARLSTKSDYTSWASLTDRTYSDRHLPPWPKDRVYPEPATVAELFQRPPTGGRRAEKSTLLFPFFAQWFVDGFLRTDPNNPLKNRSSHAIDLSQLYGSTRQQTKELRRHEGGELKYQGEPGAEFPPIYSEKEFQSLRLTAPGEDRKGPVQDEARKDDPRFLADARKQGLLAVPLPRGNIHYGMLLMSTIFLREHNRVARSIAEAHRGDPRWDDERTFQTARNVLIVMLHKVIIEDYLNHITPFYFQFSCEPGIGAERVWFRPNWMSIEFDLLYRWHALLPDSVTVARGTQRAFADLLWDTRPLFDHSLGDLITAASEQRCMEIGLFNTPSYLLQVEKDSIAMARDAHLAGYNDYRAACRYPRLQSFADVSSNTAAQDRLKELYGSVDNIEYYVGLFAEDVDRGGVLPTLMGTMVGVDAFSQALTNPLLDPRIFSADTFSEPGLADIERTGSLHDIVKRVVGPVARVSFDATGLP